MALTKVTLTGAIDTIKEGWTKFNDLIDDLLSTSNGLGASTIGVEDSAGNMAAANVEDALAEIYTDHSTTRTLAETFDENPDTTTGLTWGYLGGVIRRDNTITAITAGTIGLTDNATNYIEVDYDGTVKRNTTGFTNDRIPLRQIIVSGGAQGTSTDKRAWFSMTGDIGQTNPALMAGTNIAAGVTVETLSGDRTVLTTDKTVLKFDPDGTDRNVTLPAEASSGKLAFLIENTANGANERLTVRDDTPTSLCDLLPGTACYCTCNGTTWTVRVLLPPNLVYSDKISGYFGIGESEPHAILDIEGEIHQDFTASSGAARSETVQDVVVDVSSLASTSEIHAMDVALSGTLAGSVAAVGTHAGVDPIHQHLTTFAAPDEGLRVTSGPTYTNLIDAQEIWVANNDEIWFRAAAVFDEVEVIFTTPATKNCTLEFYYYNGSAWVEFFPADDTNGGTQNGTVRFDSGNFTAWAAAGDPAGGSGGSGYWMAIKRTRVADPGSPTITTLKVSADTDYEWDKSGDVSILSLTTAGTKINATAAEINAVCDDPVQIPLQPVGANGSYSGITATMTVDANTTGFGAALHMDTDGNWIEADADAAVTMPCGALVLETGTGSKKVLLHGFIRNDAFNWTPGSLIYVFNNPGQLTQTAPSGSGDQVQVVGYATHADRMFFNPSLVLVEIA